MPEGLDPWYIALKKPPLQPPSWIFAPVWTILYTMMCISAIMVLRKGLGDKDTRLALAAFLVQLALNLSWSPAFFGARSPFRAMVIIALLWLAILATIILFYRVSQPAAYLLVPYFIWVSFAAYLNAGIYYLNR